MEPSVLTCQTDMIVNALKVNRSCHVFTFRVQFQIFVLFVTVMWFLAGQHLKLNHIWDKKISEKATEKIFFCKQYTLHSGFKGLLCEENINDCVPEPCHHGECRDGIATFSCECYAGYTGSICNIQVQECHSNPCQNRGRCIDLVNAYQCNCPSGITGRF